MNSMAKLGMAALLGISLITGCGKESSSSDSQASAQKPSNASPPAPNTEAISRAAADFLDAVLKGDTQRASGRLTPQAIERIVASGKQFAPPGLETATFRIGQVRMPSPNQALVQCVLTDRPAGGSPRNEEMCCLMKLVENDWRVSGIAYGTGQTQPWTLSDFETGQSIPISRQPGTRTPAAQQASLPANRPSPPRTAQEPPAGVVR